MERIINVKIRDKIAVAARKSLYICGNSDFVVVFDFDDEWTSHETKTARFRYNGAYIDQIFTGNECPVPIISNVFSFEIGVFAGDLHTTTSAYVPAKKSILCGTGSPADPTPDVYNQIMEKLNDLEKNGGGTADVDPSEVIMIVDELPDPSGEEQVVYLKDDPTDSGTSWEPLLITILSNAVYSVDQSANIAALAELLGIDTGDEPEDSGITQLESTLIITSGVTVSQSGTVLTLS